MSTTLLPSQTNAIIRSEKRNTNFDTDLKLYARAPAVCKTILIETNNMEAVVRMNFAKAINLATRLKFFTHVRQRGMRKSITVVSTKVIFVLDKSLDRTSPSLILRKTPASTSGVSNSMHDTQ